MEQNPFDGSLSQDVDSLDGLNAFLPTSIAPMLNYKRAATTAVQATSSTARCSPYLSENSAIFIPLTVNAIHPVPCYDEPQALPRPKSTATTERNGGASSVHGVVEVARVRTTFRAPR